MCRLLRQVGLRRGWMMYCGKSDKDLRRLSRGEVEGRVCLFDRGELDFTIVAAVVTVLSTPCAWQKPSPQPRRYKQQPSSHRAMCACPAPEPGVLSCDRHQQRPWPCYEDVLRERRPSHPGDSSPLLHDDKGTACTASSLGSDPTVVLLGGWNEHPEGT